LEFPAEFITLFQSPELSTPRVTGIPVLRNRTKILPTFDVNAKGDGSNQPIHEEIGQFRYLADHTRPDLLASVSIMSSGTANPHDEHVKGVRTFAEYIATSHDVGLTLGGETEVDLFGFSDVSQGSRKLIVSHES
jgi:hypothetical protein